MASLRSDIAAGSMLAAALAYARAGWAVFPCSPATKGPLTGHGHRDATTDEDRIVAWWSMYPDAMIGCPMGPNTGAFVIDLDVRADGRDGVAELARLEAEHGALPPHPRVTTPSGGTHLYFAFDDDRPATTSRGRLPVGIDVRGYGGYVIVPPSRRNTGGYAWERRDLAPPHAPGWLLDLIVPKFQPLASGGGVVFERNQACDQYAEAALESEYARVCASPKGGRNTDLNRAAFSLGQLVAGGVLAEGRVRETLFRAAEACGLTQDDGPKAVHKTISSGLRGGANHPRVGPERMRRIEDIASGILRSAGLTEPDDEAQCIVHQDGTVTSLDGEIIDGASACDAAEGSSDIDPFAGFVLYGEKADPPPALVKGLLSKEGIAFIGGQSGAGKTFIVCHLAACLAAGQPFFGRRVKERVGVVILAAEGAGTLPMRLKVAGEEIAGDEPLPIAFLPSVPNLMNLKEVGRLTARLQAISRAMQERDGVRLGVVIVDTVAAAFEMKDENDNAEAASAIRRMNAISAALNLLVIGVHHFGKDSSTGLRGASAWRAGADAVLSVLAERDQMSGKVGQRELALAKSRVGEEGPISAFSLKFVKLGEDEDGDDIGSCIIVPAAADREPETPSAAAGREPRRTRAFREAFRKAMATSSESQPIMGDGRIVRVVALRHVKEKFQRLYVTGEDDGQKALESMQRVWRRAMGDIESAGYKSGFWQGEEWIWDTASELGA